MTNIQPTRAQRTWPRKRAGINSDGIPVERMGLPGAPYRSRGDTGAGGSSSTGSGAIGSIGEGGMNPASTGTTALPVAVTGGGGGGTLDCTGGGGMVDC